MCANITLKNDQREAKVQKMCKDLNCVVRTKFSAEACLVKIYLFSCVGVGGLRALLRNSI